MENHGHDSEENQGMHYAIHVVHPPVEQTRLGSPGITTPLGRVMSGMGLFVHNGGSGTAAGELLLLPTVEVTRGFRVKKYQTRAPRARPAKITTPALLSRLPIYFGPV